MALPATLGASYPTNPFPAGITTVAASGTAIQACHNFTNLANRRAKEIWFQALPGNKDVIYVVVQNGNPPWTMPGASSTINGADTTNYLNVVMVLSASDVWKVPAEISNQVTIGQFWIDAAGNNSDAVIMTIYEY